MRRAVDALERGHRRILVDSRAVAQRRVGEAGGEAPHMHLRAFAMHQTAVKDVRAHLLADARSRNEIGFRIDAAVQKLEAAGDLFVVCGLSSKLDLAAAAEVAGDLLLAHDALDRVHRRVVGVIQVAGAIDAVARSDVGHIDRRAVVDVPAVATGRAGGDLARFQHHDVRVALAEGEGRGQAGEAAADHRHVHLAFHRPGRAAGESGIRIEPVWDRFHWQRLVRPTGRAGREVR
jgi:hypothetical protein